MLLAAFLLAKSAYEKFHHLSETGEIISIIPNKILSKDEVKQIENNNYVFVPIPYFNINYIDIIYALNLIY